MEGENPECARAQNASLRARRITMIRIRNVIEWTERVARLCIKN